MILLLSVLISAITIQSNTGSSLTSNTSVIERQDNVIAYHNNGHHNKNPSPTPTLSPKPTPRITATPKPNPLPTATPTPTSFPTPIPTPSSTPSPTSSTSLTPTPTITPSPKPSPTTTSNPTLTPTPTPTATPTPSTATASPTPSLPPTISMSIYSDSTCTNKISALSWGQLTVGTTKTLTVYIRNEGNLPFTLNKSVANWNPTNLSNYCAINWNYNGQTINPAETSTVTLSLIVASNTPTTSNFGCDATINAVSI